MFFSIAKCLPKELKSNMEPKDGMNRKNSKKKSMYKTSVFGLLSGE